MVNVGGVDKVYFQAARGFVGLASFKYSISNGQGGMDYAKVRIEVFPQYDTKVTLNGPDGAVKAGSTVKLTGQVKVLQPVQVTRAAQRSALQSGLPVNLQKRTDEGWKKVATTSVFEEMEFAFKLEAKSSAKYRAGCQATIRCVAASLTQSDVKVAKADEPKRRDLGERQAGAPIPRGRRVCVVRQGLRRQARRAAEEGGRRVVPLPRTLRDERQRAPQLPVGDHHARHVSMRVVVGDRWAVSKTVTFDVA